MVTRSSAGKLTETLVRVTDPVSWALIKNIEGLGGGNSKIFYFHPYLEKIPILTHIVQLGWFNHQPDEGCFFFVFFSWFSHWCGGCLVMFCYFFVVGRCEAIFAESLSRSLFLGSEKMVPKMITRWAIYRCYNPSYLIRKAIYRGPITPFITGRGPSCRRI